MRKLGLTTDSVLPYFSQYENPSSPLYQKAFLPTFPRDFAADVQSGQLPKVSWIFTPVGYDEHPPAPPFLGEWFTDQVLRTLVSNPDVWSKTVLFHMYDENDGFFDHVAPPVAPPGTDGEYLTVHPLPDDADGFAGPIGLGFRVPMLVISPFSRGGHVCSRDLRPHLAAALPRGAVRGPGTQPLGLAPDDGRGPDRRPAMKPGRLWTLPALPPTTNDPSYIAAKGCTRGTSLESRHQPTALPGSRRPADADPGAGAGRHHLMALAARGQARKPCCP